jgi:hypothetical protein
MAQVEVDVARHVEVHEAIVIEVAKGRAATPDLVRRRNPRFDGHVREGPITVIPIQNVGPVVVNIQVLKPVIVIVRRNRAEPPAMPLDTRLARYVGKGPITVIAEEVVVGAVLDLRRLEEILDRGSVHDVKIHVAVVVVIKPNATTAVDL